MSSGEERAGTGGAGGSRALGRTGTGGIYGHCAGRPEALSWLTVEVPSGGFALWSGGASKDVTARVARVPAPLSAALDNVADSDQGCTNCQVQDTTQVTRGARKGNG